MFPTLDKIWKNSTVGLGLVLVDFIDDLKIYNQEYRKIIYIKSLYEAGLFNDDDILIIEEFNLISRLEFFRTNFSPIDRAERTIEQIINLTDKFKDIPFENEVPSFKFRNINGCIPFKFLGSGAFSNVFQIFHNDSIYVMKELKINDKTSDTFVRECGILSTLENSSSNGIIEMKDNFIKDGKFYIITEYLHNFITLESYIEKTPYGNNEKRKSNIATIVNDICNAINYIHSKGIAHRDIKPDNIMINPITLDIRIIDFGLSCNSDTIDEKVGGTPGYVDPKSMLTSYEYSINNLIKSDLWSLGATIFFCVTDDSLYNTFFDRIYESKDDSIYTKLWNATFKKEIEEYEPSEISKKIKEIYARNYEYGGKFDFDDDLSTENLDKTIIDMGINANLHNLLCRDLNSRSI